MEDHRELASMNKVQPFILLGGVCAFMRSNIIKVVVVLDIIYHHSESSRDVGVQLLKCRELGGWLACTNREVLI